MAEIQCSAAFQRNANFLAGATACVRALASIPDVVRVTDPDQSTAEYFAKKDAAVALIVGAAGELPDRAAGIIAALAEVIVGQEMDGCFQGLGGIEVESTLSDDDLRASRQEFANQVGDGEAFALAALKTPRNNGFDPLPCAV